MLQSPSNLMHFVKDTCYKSADYSIVSSLLFTLPAFKNTNKTGEDNTRRQHATADFGLDVRVWHRFLSSIYVQTFSTANTGSHTVRAYRVAFTGVNRCIGKTTCMQLQD